MCAPLQVALTSLVAGLVASGGAPGRPAAHTRRLSCGRPHARTRRLSCAEPTTDYDALRFGGTHRLYGGDAARARLEGAAVMVVGLGGVGSWAVEALARSGVGALVLIDPDEVCVSNINRQLPALTRTVGRSKARELAVRVGEISPSCAVGVREEWLTASGALSMLASEAAAAAARNQSLSVIDAIDGYREKAALVDAARELGLHIVVCGAAGGRADPTAVRLADLQAASGDPLLRATRSELRKAFGFPRGVPGARSPSRRRSRGSGSWGVPCVYSTEPPLTPDGEGPTCDRFGTSCFGTGAFGFAAAAALTRSLARGEAPPRRPPVRPPADKAESRKRRPSSPVSGGRE